MQGAAQFIGVTTLVIGLCGCQPPPAAEESTFVLARVPDREAFLESTLTVLREHDLQLERVDRERGVAVTVPTTSAQWFELWRGDTRGGYQLLESSLHTIRRVVAVDIEPLSIPGQKDLFRVSVEAEKHRYNAAERQITTASGALAIYNERIPTTEGLRGARSRNEQWVSLGRDALLEQYLLDKFLVARPEVEPISPSDLPPGVVIPPPGSEPAELRPVPPPAQPPPRATPTPSAQPAQRRPGEMEVIDLNRPQN